MRFLEKYSKIPTQISNPERKRRICGRGITLESTSCSTASETEAEADGRDGSGVEVAVVPRLVSR